MNASEKNTNDKPTIVMRQCSSDETFIANHGVTKYRETFKGYNVNTRNEVRYTIREILEKIN